MSLTQFNAIELSDLPHSPLIEPLSFDTIKNELLTQFQEKMSQDVNLLASDPIVKLIEIFAYRELLLRQRINNSAEAVLLAKASSAELDYLGARFGVKRQQQMKEGEQQIESDSRFRARIQLALEGFSTAGPAGAYIFHTFKAHPNVKDVFVEAPQFAMQPLEEPFSSLLPSNTKLLSCVFDASLASPMPGDVAITILSEEGTGQADTHFCQKVETYLNQSEIKPLTDRANVISADITEFDLEANIYLYPGPKEEEVLKEIKLALDAFLEEHHKLGHDIRRSALIGVLHQAGVQRAELISPSHDIVMGPKEAAFCRSQSVKVEGRDV